MPPLEPCRMLAEIASRISLCGTTASTGNVSISIRPPDFSLTFSANCSKARWLTVPACQYDCHFHSYSAATAPPAAPSATATTGRAASAFARVRLFICPSPCCLVVRGSKPARRAAARRYGSAVLLQTGTAIEDLVLTRQHGVVLGQSGLVEIGR